VLSLNSLIHRAISTTSEDRSEVSIQMYVYDMKMIEIVKRKEDQKKHRRREKMKKLSRTTKIVRACECEK